MKTRKKSSPGFTLTEMIVYVAILGIAVAMFSRFMTGFVKTAKVSDDTMRGSAGLRLALSRMEGDIYEANEFTGLSASSITFTADMLKNPAWDPDGDFDGDGIPNIKDTDVDNDAQEKFSLASDEQWQAGYNLEDDDDDNNNKRDVRIQLYFSSGTIYRGISVNEGAWQVTKLATDISSFTFTFFGSKREDLGKNIDLGNDGTASTSDAGEADGIISAREIDWAQSPAGHGNRSGAINIPAEFKYVTSVGVYMESDSNHDGITDAQLGTELLPPLLPLKRKR